MSLRDDMEYRIHVAPSDAFLAMMKRNSRPSGQMEGWFEYPVEHTEESAREMVDALAEDYSSSYRFVVESRRVGPWLKQGTFKREEIS